MEKHTQSLSLRLRPRELEHLRQRATMQDVSLGAYLRQLIKKDMESTDNERE